MDNFEWSAGFSAKFGIAMLEPTTLDRIPKKSALWYRDLIAAHRQKRGAVRRSEASSNLAR